MLRWQNKQRSQIVCSSIQKDVKVLAESLRALPQYDSLPSSNAGHRPVICQHSLLVILQVIVSAVFAVHGPIIWNGMPRDLWSTDVGDHYWQYADSLRNVPAHTLKHSSTFAARTIIWAI